MNLSLEPEEYRALIELAYLGEWVINAHHGPDHQDDQPGQILQRLLAVHPLAQVGRDDETGEYYMEDDWTERLYGDYILDYDDHVFWDELTERLAQRDLAKSRGVATEDIDRDDDLLELRSIEDRYRDELEQHGVDRLEITPDF